MYDTTFPCDTAMGRDELDEDLWWETRKREKEMEKKEKKLKSVLECVVIKCKEKGAKQKKETMIDFLCKVKRMRDELKWR